MIWVSKADILSFFWLQFRASTVRQQLFFSLLLINVFIVPYKKIGKVQQRRKLQKFIENP